MNTITDEILKILDKLNYDEFSEKENHDLTGDEAVLHELKKFERKYSSKQEKLKNAIYQVSELMSGNFKNRLPISPANDQLDVLSMGLNILGEELNENAVNINSFNSLFSEISIPFLIVDADNMEVLNFNEASKSLFEYKGANQYHVPVSSFASFDFVQSLNFFSNSNDSTSTFQFEHQLISRSIVVNVTKLSSYNDEANTLAIFCTDITSKLEREVLKRSLKFKDQFLANMSHEIRTPLNGVVGMTDIILSETDPKSNLGEKLMVIKNASKSLLVIINDILDLSKIEAGKMELNYLPTDLNSLINDSLSLYVPLAKEKNISILLETDTDLRQKYLIDKIRVGQVLNNFLSNAIKFTERGTVSIKVQVEKSKKRDNVKVAIVDSGVGIRKENQDKLFKKFSQTDIKSKKSYSGTGLGLVLSKEFIELMGGETGFQSEYQKGSTFWFKLNLEKTELELGNSVGSDYQFKPGLKVLLVDDKKVNLTVASLMLKKLDCIVETAENGLIAIDIIKEKTFDIVFMDIQMPEMNGVEALNYIKSNELTSSKCKIVALTANAVEGDEQKYMKLGFDSYLPKPITIDSIKNLISCL